jgi:3-deoxy-D-manno-octulosonate 8-phosphate phosphatase (KDO 8-P phosphatase)
MHTTTAALKEFTVLLLDADGVWFTGEETRGVSASGEILISKTRHLHDGQGLSFLRGLGIIVAFVGGKGEPLASIVEKLNGLPSVRSGAWSPVTVIDSKATDSIEAWLNENKRLWSDCIYMGDDRDDIEVMVKAALVVCPSNARRVAQSKAHITLTAAGGKGAVREFAELVLDARGIDEATLSAA